MKKVLVIGCVGLLSLVGLGVSMPIGKAEAKVPVLSVYGEAEVVAAPDVAKVYAVIKKTSTEIKETTDIVDAFSNLKKDLIGFGVEEENVQSLYFYDSAINFDGEIVYRACLDFYVQTENMDNLKEIIDLINEKENTKVKSISYELKNDEAYKEALTLAKENATGKAESLVNTENMEIVEIKEECFYYCNNNFKDFISSDDLIENIVVKAKVKVTMDYVQEDMVENEVLGEEDDKVEEEIDKETGEIIEE